MRRPGGHVGGQELYFDAKNFFRIHHQHGRLVTWLQTRNLLPVSNFLR